MHTAAVAHQYGIRSAVNWLTLATPTGLLVARVGGCRIVPGPRGLRYATGFRGPLPKAAAFTVGSVILFRSIRVPLGSALLDHEERHATQWACCVGVLGFPVLYALATLWSWLWTGDRFSRNPFEVRAGLADGGYRGRRNRREQRS